MSFEIKFDPDPEEFARRLERSVKETANAAVERFGHGLQEVCDQAYQEREGKSASEIFDLMRANLDARDLAVKLSDDKLRGYAASIADGKRINVKLPPPL